MARKISLRDKFAFILVSAFAVSTVAFYAGDVGIRHAFAAEPSFFPGVPEITVNLCSDGIDNDNDGDVDLDDEGCQQYIPILRVKKVLVGGDAKVSDFSLFVNSQEVKSGEENRFSPGEYTVTESGPEGYGLSYKGHCGGPANGTLTLDLGDNKTCILLNVFGGDKNEGDNGNGGGGDGDNGGGDGDNGDNDGGDNDGGDNGGGGNDGSGGGGGSGGDFACSDGIDNDSDGDIDSADRDCHTDNNAENPDSYVPDHDSEMRGFKGASGGVPDEGEVLGEFAGCGTYLDSYLGIGRQNDAGEVRKLQLFLNEFEGESIPLTGFFGPLTDAAVRRFQVRYSDQILAPWVPYGLESAQTPTGYVYKTTQRWINLLHCPDLDLAQPELP